MASVTIRNLDDKLKSKLRVSAAQHGHSMEEEARAILRNALAKGETAPRSLAKAIHQRFAKLGGLDLPAAQRDAIREPPDFAE